MTGIDTPRPFGTPLLLEGNFKVGGDGVRELTSDFLKFFELLNSKLQNSGTFKSRNWIPAQAYLRRSPRAGMTASIEKWLFDNVIAIRLWRRSNPSVCW